MNRHERRAAGKQRRILPGPDLVDGMVPLVLDHVWFGSDLQRLERELSPERLGRVSAVVLNTIDEIKCGKVRCSACETPVAEPADVAVYTVAHLGAASPLGAAIVGIPFCRNCATSEAEVSAKTRTALTRLFGGAIVSRQ